MKKLFLLLILTAAGTMLSGAGQIKIVSKDKAASDFLKAKLSRILGKQSFNSGEMTLYVGRTAQAGKAGVSFDKKTLGEYGYRITSRDGKNIFLGGATPQGTLFAAGDFLKRFAGWRKFYPGETGEVLPALQKLALPAAPFDFKEVPTIPHYNPSSGNRDEIFSRTGLRVYHYATTHALDKVVPPKKYAKSHPEYYPVRYGKRIDVSKYKRAMGWNPCVSNPDMPKLLDQYLSSLKKRRNVTLSVNDGGGDCQCAPCEAIYKKHGNQYIEFYKTVNDIIAKKYPGKLGVFSAYGTRSNRAPENLKLGEHVMPFICGARPGIYTTEIRAWKKTGVKYIGIYDYMYTFGSAFMTPQFYPHSLAANWRNAIQHGMNALTLEVYTACPILDAPRLYVMDELGWNINADVDALLQDYYTTMFGPHAAKAVARFYSRLEEIYCRKMLPSYYHGRRKVWQFDNYTLSDLDYLHKALDQALTSPATPLQKKRLMLLKKCFTLSAFCIETAVRGREAVKLSGSPEAVAEYVAKGYKALTALEHFTLTPEEEKEIFIQGNTRFLKTAVNTVEKFKHAVLHNFLRPIIDDGSMKAFDKITAALGKEKAVDFWKKYPSLPPAQGQLKLLRTKAKNMLPNPGFELLDDKTAASAVDQQKFTAANYSSWTAVAAEFKLSATEKRSGKYGASISKTEGSACFVNRGKILVKPDRWYRFSLWVKNNNANSGDQGYFTIRFNHHGGKLKLPPVAMTSEKFTPACIGKWHRYIRYFRTPAIKGGILNVAILMGIGTQTGNNIITFDDLELIEL